MASVARQQAMKPGECVVVRKSLAEVYHHRLYHIGKPPSICIHLIKPMDRCLGFGGERGFIHADRASTRHHYPAADQDLVDPATIFAMHYLIHRVIKRNEIHMFQIE
jgi:hypothetical protein